MNPVSPIAVVDVGNTSTKLATLREDELQVRSFSYQKDGWSQLAIRYPASVHDAPIRHWRIASVNKNRSAELETCILDENPNALIHRVGHHDVPMKTSVDHPERLGIDRLLSGYMAAKCFDTPLIVVSFGTAVTVDWVNSDKIFCGGLIIPGIQLQAESLALGAEALPKIQWTGEDDLFIPGKNTESAIRSGILLGLASAIDGLVHRFAEQNQTTPAQINIVITGGNATAITTHLRITHQIAPNLVCQALMELPVVEQA